jgi:transposase-like protein
MSEATFTPQQIAALDALSSGATLTEAAEQAGVHRNTIANWRRESRDFQMALANAQYDRALYFREKAESMADLAFDAIRGVLIDPKASPSTRLKAALAILKTISTQMDPQKKVKVTAQDILDAPPPQNPKNLHNPAQPPDPPKTIRYAHPEPGRNELCPCGSNLKYKRCCLNKPKEMAQAVAA